MPQVAIQIRSGRDPGSVRRLISAVTHAVSTTLDASPATVRVIVTEVPTTHWANGDVTLAERALGDQSRSTDESENRIGAAVVRLDEARLSAREVEQFAGCGDLTLDDAYGVLLGGIALRTQRGERVVGLKLGFTSKEKREQMGVSDVILGVLTDEMRVADGSELDYGSLIHPRVEPEVAFRLSDDVTAAVLAGEEGLLPYVTHVAAAMEVIDSRYRNFSFSLEDVVADNTSASHFVVGTWRELTGAMKSGGLSNLSVGLRIDGGQRASGSTRAILGDPLKAVSASRRLAAQYGHPLEAGHVILAGSATAAVPLPAGALVEVRVEGLGAASLRTTTPAATAVAG